MSEQAGTVCCRNYKDIQRLKIERSWCILVFDIVWSAFLPGTRWLWCRSAAIQWVKAGPVVGGNGVNDLQPSEVLQRSYPKIIQNRWGWHDPIENMDDDWMMTGGHLANLCPDMSRGEMCLVIDVCAWSLSEDILRRKALGDRSEAWQGLSALLPVLSIWLSMFQCVSMCFNDLQCVFPPVGKAKHGKTMKTDTTGDSLRRVGRVPRRCGCGVCFGTTAVVWRTPICWTKSWRHANRRKKKHRF